MTGIQLELPFPEPKGDAASDLGERFRRVFEEAFERVKPLIDRLRQAEHLTADILNFRFGSAA